jgi:hypothetical protein
MADVADPFGVADVGLLPELFEPLTATGQFIDECQQAGVVGIVSGVLP